VTVYSKCTRALTFFLLPADCVQWRKYCCWKYPEVVVGDAPAVCGEVGLRGMPVSVGLFCALIGLFPGLFWHLYLPRGWPSMKCVALTSFFFDTCTFFFLTLVPTSLTSGAGPQWNAWPWAPVWPAATTEGGVRGDGGGSTCPHIKNVWKLVRYKVHQGTARHSR